MQRVLTQISGHQILPLVKEMRDWIEVHRGGLNAFFEEREITDLKPRLRYKAAFVVIQDWLDKTLPCDIENVKEVLVWGESPDDPALRLEYRFHKPVSVPRSVIDITRGSFRN